MSRRRFGDADNTYKDFISAIDDHKRTRTQAAQQAATVASILAAQQQQQQQQLPPVATASSINYQGGSALGPGQPYPSYASVVQQQDQNLISSPSLRATELAQELPIGATEKDIQFARDSFSLRRTGGGYSGSSSASGSARNILRQPLHLTGAYEEEPLLHDDRKTTLGGGGDGAEHAWLTKRNLDLVVQRKSIWIFANGMFGVLLMCIILQVCWDPSWQLKRYSTDMEGVPADYYSDKDWVTHRLSMTPEPLPHSWSWNSVAQECPSPVRSAVTETLKILLTVSTLILCWQILDRKRLQVNIKFREQRRKLKAKGYNQERDQLYMTSLSNAASVSTLGLLSLSGSQFRWELWAQLIVCLIQPIPFTHQLTHGFVDDKIGMLMWMRIFLGFRVIRDCSEIWLSRRSIKHQSSFQTKVPDFDWWLSCKTIAYRSPLFFAGCFYILCIIIFGHCLYLAERERLPTFFTIWSSLFVSFQGCSVGWPADVWEIYMPITILGKFMSMFAAMAGLILISFVIVTVGAALHPSKFEENALNFIAMDKIRQKERDGSAALIQYVWKNAQREQELEQKLQPKNPALYEEISEQEEKAFMENFIQKSKDLRTIRRERAELEERSDPTSERNISPMDAYFDTKLEAIRTDIMHQNSKNNQQFMNILATLNQLVHKTIQKEKQAAMKAQPPTVTGGGTGTGKKHRASMSLAGVNLAEKKTGTTTEEAGQQGSGQVGSETYAQLPEPSNEPPRPESSAEQSQPQQHLPEASPQEYSSSSPLPPRRAEVEHEDQHSDEGQPPGERRR